jgi:1,4-alpha-glucan branching enzyme
VPVPASKNDGMGSLLYADGTCRFRVWAPFARRVQVRAERRVDGSTWPANPVDLVKEGDSGNWSADVGGVQHLDRYKYLIDNVGGPGNDASQTWERADARAMQVDHSGGGGRGVRVAAVRSGATATI